MIVNTSTLVSNIVNVEQKTKPLEYVKSIVKSWCNEELWPHLKFVDTNQMLKLNLEEDNHLFQTLFIRIIITILSIVGPIVMIVMIFSI